ncbi:class I SAM-dependent methyltransferase [Roseibium hamelinense]|uniref:class I SAM-dependent methyltransferase n=1 Tax=Roseibium hamelinense TaxID=150831 RepID=UPI0031384257
MHSDQKAAETAQLMDGIYKYQRHFYDVTRKYYLLGRDHLIEQLEPGPDQTVLELGCGTGRNLIGAAKRYPNVTFHGIDISQQMLETARESVARAGLSDRIYLHQGDASSSSFVSSAGAPEYDRVFYSYTLSMMPVWREALAAGLDCLSADGRLCIVDFGQLDRLPVWFARLLRTWLASFHVTPRADLLNEVAKLSDRSGRPMTSTSLYRGYATYVQVS